MHVAGVFMVMTLFFGGFLLAQALFFQHTGRTFWRAMVPTSLRFTLLPADKVAMDSFMVMEEWAALMFLGALLMLPMIAINIMGFIKIF
jgi:hypothetical protein